MNLEIIQTEKGKNVRNGIARVIDLVLIFGVLAVLLLLINQITPLVIAPNENLSMNERSVLFDFKNVNSILIDNNLNFSSPSKIVVEEGLVINLEPGVYYWKLQGIGESEIRRVNIISRVDLMLKKVDMNSSGDVVYQVVNVGSEKMNVDVYDGDNVVDNFVLDREGNNSLGGKNE